MFNFTKFDYQGTATAIVGALLLSTACITAAVGPARPIETTPVHQFASAGVQFSDEANA